MITGEIEGAKNWNRKIKKTDSRRQRARKKQKTGLGSIGRSGGSGPGAAPFGQNHSTPADTRREIRSCRVLRRSIRMGPCDREESVVARGVVDQRVSM